MQPAGAQAVALTNHGAALATAFEVLVLHAAGLQLPLTGLQAAGLHDALGLVTAVVARTVPLALVFVLPLPAYANDEIANRPAMNTLVMGVVLGVNGGIKRVMNAC